MFLPFCCCCCILYQKNQKKTERLCFGVVFLGVFFPPVTLWSLGVPSTLSYHFKDEHLPAWASVHLFLFAHAELYWYVCLPTDLTARPLTPPKFQHQEGRWTSMRCAPPPDTPALSVRAQCSMFVNYLHLHLPNLSLWLCRLEPGLSTHWACSYAIPSHGLGIQNFRCH